MKTYQGCCHCGACRLEVDKDLDLIRSCNCSVYARRWRTCSRARGGCWSSGRLARQWAASPMPEDIAAAIAFLISNAARQISSVVLPVDGRFTAKTGQPDLAAVLL